MLVVNGGKIFWARASCDSTRGVVVIFPRVSIFHRPHHRQQLHFFLLLFSSFRWNVLVCYSHFLTLFNPDKAESLACAVLNELVQELRRRPSPVVFMAFSDGTKACLYKVFQILQESCRARLAADDVHLVRNCVSGHIFDSAPADFSWYIGSHFSMLPAMFKLPGSLRLGSWIARGLGSGLDALFLTNFESQSSDYLETLYSSVDLGAPYLILCSEDDDRALYQHIFGFSQHIRNIGGQVKLVTWSGSSHITSGSAATTEEYKAEIRRLLEQAAAVYSSKKGTKIVSKECKDDDISELVFDLRKAVVYSTHSRSTVDRGETDSNEIREAGGSNFLWEEAKEGSTVVASHPGIEAHGILSHVLFDVCIPKNIEGWDIKFDGSLNGRPFSTARRRSPLDAIKCICRSRL